MYLVGKSSHIRTIFLYIAILLLNGFISEINSFHIWSNSYIDIRMRSVLNDRATKQSRDKYLRPLINALSVEIKQLDD